VVPNLDRGENAGFSSPNYNDFGGARVTYSDPFVPRLDYAWDGALYSRDPLGASSEADCVVIATDHSSFDYAAILANSRLIIDTRNALKRFSSNKIIRL
jgi:UDP-N-acetyl-D-glucosamine dehydrogenase